MKLRLKTTFWDTMTPHDLQRINDVYWFFIMGLLLYQVYQVTFAPAIFGRIGDGFSLVTLVISVVMIVFNQLIHVSYKQWRLTHDKH